MKKQLKNRLSEQEVIDSLEKYLSGEIRLEQALGLLQLKRRGFYNLLKRYREEGTRFCLVKDTPKAWHTIAQAHESKILEELAKEKHLIEDTNNPIRFYNYSYVKEQLETQHGIKVSLPTIITRAKKTAIISHVLLNAAMTERC